MTLSVSLGYSVAAHSRGFCILTWSEAALAQLTQWGIESADAIRAGMFEVTDASQLYAELPPLAGIAFSYLNPDRSNMEFDRGPFVRVRLLDPPQARTFVKTKPQRYAQPRSSGVRAYFPALADWQSIAGDPTVPVLITEGEAKAIRATAAGYPCIGLGGVSNWNIANTERLIPDLLKIKWQRPRRFGIVFDSDAITNRFVLLAEARLIRVLQNEYGAQGYIIRLPQDGDEKIGLDDYLNRHGAAAFQQLIMGATEVGHLDAKIMQLNERYSLIESECSIWDARNEQFVKKDFFLDGSEASGLYHEILGEEARTPKDKTQPKPKQIQVAKAWLRSPHAARFADMQLAPDKPSIFEDERGRRILNKWRPYDSEPGNPMPWLKLTEFLFQDLPIMDDNGEPCREYPLKLLAYHAQNPATKVSHCIVLVSDAGSGKGLWTALLADAFAPWSEPLRSSDLHNNFQGWLETTQLAVVNEAMPLDLEKGSQIFKSLVGDEDHRMNEKFRIARKVKNYTLFVITANEHAAARTARDDRRVFVVECPEKWRVSKDERELRAWFGPIHEWRRAGGGKIVMHYLLNYPLNGWTPGVEPPKTPEKLIAQKEGMTLLTRFANDIATATDGHPLARWLATAEAWAAANVEMPMHKSVAMAALAEIDKTPLKPFMTAEEITTLMPNLIYADAGRRIPWDIGPGQVSQMLRDQGVRFLRSADPDGFIYRGRKQHFLIVYGADEFVGKTLTQADFDRVTQNAPTYGQFKRHVGRQK